MKKILSNPNQIMLPVLLGTLLLLLLPKFAAAEFKYTIVSVISPTSVEGLLVTILNTFVVIATPIIVLFIIYAGFLYVTAKGNAQQVQQATAALTYAVIGGVIIIGAVAISQVIKNVVDAFAA